MCISGEHFPFYIALITLDFLLTYMKNEIVSNYSLQDSLGECDYKW